MGLSGAVWIDADRNGKRNSARDYATLLISQGENNIGLLIRNLASYDEAVAIQAAALLHSKGIPLNGAAITKALRRATPETKAGFQRVIDALRTGTE